MLNLPAWLYKALAAIGGIGFLIQNVARPAVIAAIRKYLESHDEPVWMVVREPRFKMEGMQGGKPFYSRSIEAPYPLMEIAERVKRTQSSVRRSLHRLEKRGRAKDVHGGWMRA